MLEIIQKCGLESVSQVAKLNGIDEAEIDRAYRQDYPQFQRYIFRAIDKLHEPRESNESADRL